MASYFEELKFLAALNLTATGTAEELTTETDFLKREFIIIAPASNTSTVFIHDTKATAETSVGIPIIPGGNFVYSGSNVSGFQAEVSIKNLWWHSATTGDDLIIAYKEKNET